MSSSDAAIIAGTSAIGGGLIVAASNFAVTWLQGRAADKTELQRALIELWAVVSRIDHRLRTEPQPGRTARAVNKQMASRLPLLDHAIGLTRRRLLEPDLDAFVIEMNNAMAAASMLAPLSLLPAMSTLTDVMAEAASEDDGWRERWTHARTDFFLACRERVGSGVLDAP